MKPASEKKVIMTAPLAALNRRSVNSRTSSIGCSARRSSATKMPTSTAVSAKPAMVEAEAQPRSGASMMVQVSRVSIATETPRPGLSSAGAAGSRDSGTRTKASAAATTATGARAMNTLPQ